MTKMTITEALAELKTIEKRLVKKQEYVLTFLYRREGLKDPLVKEDGGSRGSLERTRQSINDLQDRIVRIRTSVQAANLSNTLTVNDLTKTVAEWLTWRKEVAPTAQRFLTSINTKIQVGRAEAARSGAAVVTDSSQAKKDTDVVVNIDETDLAREAEFIEEVLGTLDGQLSLRNATTTVEF